MRALIWIIAIFAFAAGLAMLAGANEAYVLVVMPPWRLQASLNLVVMGLLASFVLLYLIVRVVSQTLDLPGRVGAYRSRRRHEKAARASREALRALFEGRLPEALRQARVAYAAGDAGAEAALVAARAAHAQRDDRAFREWMSKAAAADGGRVAALLTEAELAIDDRAWDDAAAALGALGTEAGGNATAIRLRLETARGRGNWAAVPELVRQSLAHRGLTPDEARALLRSAHLAVLESLQDRPNDLADYWHQLGREALADREFVVRALPTLARAGKATLARKLVERLLDESWDTTLARRYALCVGEGDEARDALSRSERWLGRRPDDPGLLYALGRQCITAHIWGKAQSYLERSLALDPQPETHLALAELFELTDHPDAARRHYALAARFGVPA